MPRVHLIHVARIQVVSTCIHFYRLSPSTLYPVSATKLLSWRHPLVSGYKLLVRDCRRLSGLNAPEDGPWIQTGLEYKPGGDWLDWSNRRRGGRFYSGIYGIKVTKTLGLYFICFPGSPDTALNQICCWAFAAGLNHLWRILLWSV